MIGNIIKKWCDENSVSLSKEQIGKFELYASLLKEWNEKMNLTAITDDEGIAVKHFIDCIALIRYCRFSGKEKIIDIGTGAGFPGIPLKIMLPEIRLTMLDSLNKRLVFLAEIGRQLGFEYELIHGRAEEFSIKPEYREKFDIAVSRAVANLPSLCEYCIPYVRTGGYFISMKGPEGLNELAASENALKHLGGRIAETVQADLPDGSSRCIITIEKSKSTPLQFPRRGKKINKDPL